MHIRSILLPASLLFFVAAACSDGDDDNGGHDAGTPVNDSGMQQGTPDAATGEDVVPGDTGNNNPPACDPGFGAGPGCGNDPGGTWTYRAACGKTAVEDDIRGQ